MDFSFLSSDLNSDLNSDFIDFSDAKYKKEDNTFDMKINSELKKEFNIKCIRNGTSMSKVLKDYIKEYIKQ